MYIAWPEGKRFAFSIIDDTDNATVVNVKPVYDMLAECNLRTTKTVWPLKPTQSIPTADTLDDPEYRDWIVTLQANGFEIAFHGAADEPSRRNDVVRALDFYRDVLGRDPRIHTNHFRQSESVYWGKERLHGLRALAYHVSASLAQGREAATSLGAHEDSPFFWGDICRERITYVRNFAFLDVNTLERDPMMPYHDPARPWVNYWYASCDGGNVRSYVKRTAERWQDRLEAEGGACIMYTHFGKGFDDGGIDAEFRRLMERLAAKRGWFVPVSTLLDHLLQVNGHRVITRRERRRLERDWLRYKLLAGTT